MVDALYQKQDSFGLRPWSSYARDAGIRDTVSFVQCAGDTVTIPAIARGEAAARKLNLMGTPSILLNDWHFGSTPTQPQLVQAIDDVLAGRSSYRR